MKQAVLTLALAVLVAQAAHAEDTLGDHVDSVTSSAGSALDSAKARALAEAEQVVDSAASTADDVAKMTTEKAGEAKEAAREQAKKAAGYGEELSSQVSALARDQASKLSTQVLALLVRGKHAAVVALASARSEARDLLMGAAEALDQQNAEARNDVRRAHWEQLKVRHGLEGARPSSELSEELRDHEYRVARLTRVRALADDAEDTNTVARSERLLEAEHGRHRRRLLALRDAQRATEGDDP